MIILVDKCNMNEINNLIDEEKEIRKNINVYNYILRILYQLFNIIRIVKEYSIYKLLQ